MRRALLFPPHGDTTLRGMSVKKLSAIFPGFHGITRPGKLESITALGSHEKSTLATMVRSFPDLQRNGGRTVG